MRKEFFLVLIVSALLLLGCASQTPPAPTSTPQATGQQAGTATPTPVPSIATPSPSPTAIPTPTPGANKTVRLSFSQDEGTRVEGSVPYAFKLKDGRTRLYYCGMGGILSSISSDGLSFQKEDGVRIQGPAGWASCDPTAVDLPDGKVRMYYKIAQGQGGPGQAIHKIASAVSSDGGLNFQDEGVRIDSEKTGDNGWASVPEAIVLPDGRVRIYYVSGDPQAMGGIASAVSSDGLNFVKEPGARLPSFVDPAVVQLPSGVFMIFAVLLPFRPPNDKLKDLKSGIYTFASIDGLNFTGMMPVLIAEGGAVYDPGVLKVDDETLRVYYGKDLGSQTGPNIVTKSITGKISEG